MSRECRTGAYARVDHEASLNRMMSIREALPVDHRAREVFSSRKIEKATYETLPMCFIAGDLHPDHDTLAHFRKSFLGEIQELFVQVLLLAQASGYLKLGNISVDGSKVQANASKSHAVSYKRLLALEVRRTGSGVWGLG